MADQAGAGYNGCENNDWEEALKSAMEKRRHGTCRNSTNMEGRGGGGGGGGGVGGGGGGRGGGGGASKRQPEGANWAKA